jgi:hypothetical protein
VYYYLHHQRLTTDTLSNISYLKDNLAECRATFGVELNARALEAYHKQVVARYTPSDVGFVDDDDESAGEDDESMDPAYDPDEPPNQVRTSTKSLADSMYGRAKRYKRLRPFVDDDEDDEIHTYRVASSVSHTSKRRRRVIVISDDEEESGDEDNESNIVETDDEEESGDEDNDESDRVAIVELEEPEEMAKEPVVVDAAIVLRRSSRYRTVITRL